MGWVKGSDRNFEASQTERYRRQMERRWVRAAILGEHILSAEKTPG